MNIDAVKIRMDEWPTSIDWEEVYRRAMVTVGRDDKMVPGLGFRRRILNARHSPIRRLRFTFTIENIPYWVACELRTHVHDMPYVADFGVYIKSSRNDRQKDFDRNAARQDNPVNMIMDINGEQIMVLANKRLCMKATKEARQVVAKMCALVEDECPEYVGFLVPMCEYHGGACHEMITCGRPTIDAQTVRHGKWVFVREDFNGYITAIYQCSECGRTIAWNMMGKLDDEAPYCHCGAKMDGGADDND